MDPSYVEKKRITVVGGARSGLAALKLLDEAGASVFLSEYGSGRPAAHTLLAERNIPHEFEGHTSRALDADCIVVSPGVPSTIPLLLEARQRGIPMFSEIEVGFWFCKAPIVAVTGTNGKTTTTSLLGHVVKQSGRPTYVAGNIGLAFSEIARQTTKEDLVVLEVSSFQLDHVSTFRPACSVILNITPDHLDRYDYNFENYIASKLRIFESQRAGDALIFNVDDPLLNDRARPPATQRGIQIYGISLKQEVRDGAFLRKSHIVIRLNQEEEILMRKEELALKGPHNVVNSLAAAIAARVMEIPSLVVRESLSSFEGVAHRLEFVRELNGVQYINDSKATNVNAVWYALESYQQNILLIAGGRDKGNDYTTLKPLVRRNVRMVIAIGESAAKIGRELGVLAEQHTQAESLAEAVRVAHDAAVPGEVVLLSPACASFDMFNNYEERGNAFKKHVMDL